MIWIICSCVVDVLFVKGVNGSGKHNNWSLATNDGTNLFNVGELAANSGDGNIFPVIMAAIIKALDENGTPVHHSDQ